MISTCAHWKSYSSMDVKLPQGATGRRIGERVYVRLSRLLLWPQGRIADSPVPCSPMQNRAERRHRVGRRELMRFETKPQSAILVCRKAALDAYPSHPDSDPVR
jgi:hypothetical protein